MAESHGHVPTTPLRQVAITFSAVTLGAVVISRLGAAPPLDEYVHVAVATLFLWTAVRLAQRDPRGVAWFGLALGGLFAAPDTAPNRGLVHDLVAALPSFLREVSVALVLAAVIFPPFAFAFAFWHAPTHAMNWSLPDDVVSFVLAQVLVVGLPEEALFRGYFQTRLTDAFPQTFTLARRQWPWVAIVLQAVLFALLHFVVDLDVTRLSVFFPGLLFGLMRATRGGIGAAVFFHALCNLYSDVLVRGWL